MAPTVEVGRMEPMVEVGPMVSMVIFAAAATCTPQLVVEAA